MSRGSWPYLAIVSSSRMRSGGRMRTPKSMSYDPASRDKWETIWYGFSQKAGILKDEIARESTSFKLSPPTASPPEPAESLSPSSSQAQTYSSDSELLYRVVHPRYTAGFLVRDGRVVRAAPILARKILFLPAQAAIKVLVSSGAVVEPA